MAVTNDVFQEAGNELQRRMLLNKINKVVMSICPLRRRRLNVRRKGRLAYFDCMAFVQAVITSSRVNTGMSLSKGVVSETLLQ